MTQRGPFLFVIALLITAGVVLSVLRNQEFGIPFVPAEEQQVWQVEARVEYIALGGASQAILTLPPEQSGIRVINEGGASTGFGFALDQSGGQRRARWSRREGSGEQTLFYKLELATDPNYEAEISDPATLHEPRWDQPYQTAAQDVLTAVVPLSADGITLAQQLVQAMAKTPRDQSFSLLLDVYERPQLLADLLSAAAVPARPVQVLRLEDGRRRQSLETYVQLWQNGRWHLFDPASGQVTDSTQLLLWQTSTPAVLEVLGGTRSRVSFSIIEQARSTLAIANEDTGIFVMSLYALPIAEQNMFKLIMLLPVGALVVVLMRVLIGVKTSGTFMPVLIALAFLQTELVPGLVSFLIVVAAGLLIRSYLSALNLLLVARIATLVVLVIAMISVFSVVSYRLGLMGGLTITFFPMIIMAWTIERMSIIWEEEGPREVLKQGGGSLLVAVLAFLLMDVPLVRHLAFHFPELHLVVLAIILMLGRYTGYRLLELRRFASFPFASN